MSVIIYLICTILAYIASRLFIASFEKAGYRLLNKTSRNLTLLPIITKKSKIWLWSLVLGIPLLLGIIFVLAGGYFYNLKKVRYAFGHLGPDNDVILYYIPRVNLYWRSEYVGWESKAGIEAWVKLTYSGYAQTEIKLNFLAAIRALQRNHLFEKGIASIRVTEDFYQIA